MAIGCEGVDERFQLGVAGRVPLDCMHAFEGVFLSWYNGFGLLKF